MKAFIFFLIATLAMVTTVVSLNPKKAEATWHWSNFTECIRGKQFRYCTLGQNGGSCNATQTPFEVRDCQPVLSPTPTVTPTATPSATPTPTVEPTTTPTPTNTPEEPKGLSQPSAPECTDVTPDKVPANFHIYRNGDQARVVWFYDATNFWKVVVYYGQGKKDQHSAIFTNKPGEGFIKGLGNGDFDFRATFLNGCTQGKSTPWVEDGPTNHWILFR